jgi:hypothetical protein
LFFGQARVIELVFNQNYEVTREQQSPKLVIPAKLGLGNPDTIYVNIDDDHNTYLFAPDEKNSKKPVSMNIWFEPVPGNRYLGHIGRADQDWGLSPEDSVRVKSSGQLYLMADGEMRCFCDSSFLVTSVNDSMRFECLDDYLAAKSATSFFYKYIEVIPQRGTQLMKGMAPFIKNFLDYMSVALERLDEGRQDNKNPINMYSGEDNKDAVQPVEEETQPQPSTKQVEDDTLNSSLDTTNRPTIRPSVDTTPEVAAPKEVEDEG